MKEIALEKDVDLLLVDTGDLHDGTGLSDGFPAGDIDGHDVSKKKILRRDQRLNENISQTSLSSSCLTTYLLLESAYAAFLCLMIR